MTVAWRGGNNYLVLSSPLHDHAQQLATADDTGEGTSDAEHEEHTADVVHAELLGAVVRRTLLQKGQWIKRVG